MTEPAHADPKSDGKTAKRRLPVSLLAGLGVIVLIGLVVAGIALRPAAPDSFRLATGSPDGAYAAAGSRIAERMAEDSVGVDMVATQGSLENLARLTSEDADQRVDAAIVQGGVGLSTDDAETPLYDNLQSLGAVFYEPFWIFASRSANVTDLRDLEGLRVAAGGAQSGTRALLSVLLAENGVGPSDVVFNEAGGGAAAEALLTGQVDVAVFVTGVERPFIRELFEATRGGRIVAVSLERAPAYARRHGYLQHVVLPRGVIDLERDIPVADVSLVVSAASLVVREDFHPALQALVLQTSDETFREKTILAPSGAFPNRDLTTFPLSPEANRYFERGGPSFLRRYLPFWAANLVDRLWVLAIPALTLLYPLVRAAPPVYRWRIRRRIVVWYGELRKLEREGLAATTLTERDDVRARLNKVLEETANLEVPLPYNDDVYRLRSHVRFVDALVAGDANPVKAAAT